MCLCEREQVLTDGQPLHWDLTFSAMIPTAASLPSIDLTTPVTSFPAASGAPASVLTNVRVCLESEAFKYFKMCPILQMAIHINSLLRPLPRQDFSCSRSAGVNSQRVCFFSYGRADETIFKCEHCNRTGLPAHTQDLRGGTFISNSVTFKFWHGELVWTLTYLTVCGESGLCSPTRLQDLGSCHLTFDCLVLDCAPSRHVILFPEVKVCKH